VHYILQKKLASAITGTYNHSLYAGRPTVYTLLPIDFITKWYCSSYHHHIRLKIWHFWACVEVKCVTFGIFFSQN